MTHAPWELSTSTTITGVMALRSFGDKTPMLGRDVFVDESAQVIGDVRLRDGASVWPCAVLRADDASIDIGEGSAVMDLAFVEAPEGGPVKVGPGCIVSHCARLHGCTIGRAVLIGIGATVLDKAVIGEGSIVASGALVTPNAEIRPGSVVMGVPGEVVRDADASNESALAEEVRRLRRKAQMHLDHHR